MKKIFVIAIIALLIGIASATSYTIGSSITQAQYNQIDFEKENFNPLQTKLTKTDTDLIFQVAYQTYTKQQDGTWRIETTQTTLPYSIERYSTCRRSGKTISVCTQEIIDNVAQQWQYYDQDHRDYLDSQKIDDFGNELDPRDLNIF